MKKLLLTSVFGPYGVDNQFRRNENIMELFHNQVTREQGVFSLRMHHPSLGLYLIAENINIPTAVLDFPTRTRFIAEIKKGYEYIGISFIVPNFMKARHMAELVRKYSPETKIILGGHGTSIENITELIPCDHLCQGDGVHFMRSLLGQDVNAEINHPLLLSAFNKRFLGAPGSKDAGIIMTGVGCVNGCRFCSTTHYFQKQYTSFIKTGREFFELCQRMEKKFGVTEFFVMDENFLKHKDRATELLSLMEEHGKAYSFGIFSSAEAVTSVGPEFLERLGVDFLWMGVESKKDFYEKNRGIDFTRLIKDLRGRGVSVLASGILFLEHHTKETIHEDIDFMVGLNADFVQFMQLGPLPGTILYRDYEREGKLLKDIPFEEWHGQKRLWFKHPHFSGEESEQFHTMAFKKDFKANGPSILRMLDTAIRGAESSRKRANTPFMEKRNIQRTNRCTELYPLLNALFTHAPDKYTRDLASDVQKRFYAYYDAIDFGMKVRSAAVQVFIIKEKIRNALIWNNMRQPGVMLTPYRMSLQKFRDMSYVGKKITGEWNILRIKLGLSSQTVQLKLSGILDGVNIKKLQNSIVTYLKKENQSIILNLSNLQNIEEEALRRFLKKIENYQNQFHLVYSRNIESTRHVFENLIGEFSRVSFVAV